jgi:excisionase family DNA binding protein
VSTRRGKQSATDPSAAIPRQRTGEPVPSNGGWPEFLTVREMCRVLKIGRSTWYDWRAKGKTPDGIKLPNGEIRVDKAVFDQWLGRLEAA